MAGERLMSEGTTGPETGETGTHPVEIPGSSPEHKKSYVPPTSEEKARLEALGRPLVFGDISSPDRGGVHQPEVEIPEALPPVTPEHRAELEQEYGKALTDDQIRIIDQAEFEQQVRMRAAHKAQERLEAGGIGLPGDEKKEKWDEVESSHPLPVRTEADGSVYESVRIFNQYGSQMWVYWPKDRAEANKRVRNLLARIELEKGSLGQQITTEYTRITSILSSLKGKEITDEMTPEDIKKDAEMKKIAIELEKEVIARMIFHEVSQQYENSSNLEVVIEAAQKKLQPEHFTAIFGIRQGNQVKTKFNPDGEEFNPIVASLQYYEDHGEEFTEFSSKENRPVFGKKVQKDLVKRFGGKEEDYESAQLLAERMFRFTCRAVMFDSLVDEKGLRAYRKKEEDDYQAREDVKEATSRGEEPPEKVYTPIPDYLRITDDYYRGDKLNEDKKYNWIGNGDGCDYDTRRAMRQRELLIKEQVTLHGHVQLLEGVDCYGGDFFTRKEGVVGKFTVGKRVGNEIVLGKFEVGKFEKEEELTEKEEEDKRKNLFVVYDEPGREHSDRELHNAGEQVGRVDFKQLDNFDFSKMGSGLMGLWASRCVVGAEANRKALTETSECFLRNPNEGSLYKQINTFDTSKENAKEAKKQLEINFIKFASTEREEKTGKPKYDRTAIVGMVNNLTGLTDPNKPPFTEYADRNDVLEKVFGHKYTDLITKGIIAKDFILGFFLGILKSILKQGFSDVGK